MDHILLIQSLEGTFRWFSNRCPLHIFNQCFTWLSDKCPPASILRLSFPPFRNLQELPSTHRIRLNSLFRKAEPGSTWSPPTFPLVSSCSWRHPLNWCREVFGNRKRTFGFMLSIFLLPARTHAPFWRGESYAPFLLGLLPGPLTPVLFGAAATTVFFFQQQYFNSVSH